MTSEYDEGLLEQAEELDKVMDILYDADMVFPGMDPHQVVKALVETAQEHSRFRIALYQKGWDVVNGSLGDILPHALKYYGEDADLS